MAEALPLDPCSILFMHPRFEPLITRNSTVVETRFGSETVLMLVEPGLCFALGEFGSEVWSQLSVPELAATLIERLRELYYAPRGASSAMSTNCWPPGATAV